MFTPRRTLASLLVVGALGFAACGGDSDSEKLQQDAQELQEQGRQLQEEAQKAAQEVQDGTKSAEEAAGSETVASESGGFTIRNTNDLVGGIRRIADESRHYYLLGYTPANPRRDGGFRKIQVEVAGGYEVRARKGYYAPREGEAATARRGPDADIQRALDAAHPLPGIPLRMAAYVLEETTPGQAKATRRLRAPAVSVFGSTPSSRAASAR